MYLPVNVLTILNKLNSSGFEAYVVGGAVRDFIMGVCPHDYDITTSALPSEIKELFPEHFALGEKFGTISVVTENEPIEITTFRKESGYSDGRHPDNVEFVTSVYDDLCRRDFTINAIAYNPNTGFVDPFNGILDIKNGVIKAVNNPVDRFNEDGLRIIRAVRFASKLNFKIETNTLEAMKSTINMLDFVAEERIGPEFLKILCSVGFKGALTDYSFVIEKIIPEWKPVKKCDQNNKWHIYNLEEHIIQTIATVKNTERLKLAAFFHDIGKPLVKVTDIDGCDHFNNHAFKSAELTELIMTRLRFSSKEIKNICLLVQYHDIFWNPSKPHTKRLLNILGDELFLDIIELRKADILAQAPRDDKSVEVIMGYYNEIKEAQAAISIKDLAISGKDVMETLNIQPSPEVGNILKKMLELVINEEIENNKESLIEEIKSQWPHA